MGGARQPRNKAPGTIASAGSLKARNRREADMAQDREKITTGPNERAIDENIAGTGPGIPDEALAPGEELPQPPTAEEERRIRERLGVPDEEDTLPLDGE
jgi:hypothetical protein